MALQCPAEARGLRSLRLTMVDSDTDMELMSHPLASQSSPWSLPGTELLSPARPQLLRLLRLITLLPSSASVKLTPRLMPTTAMEAMVDTVSATPLATVLATDTVVTERGPLILRPTPTMVMVDMVDTASASMESLPHA